MQRFLRTYLVRGKAVVQLNNADLVSSFTGLETGVREHFVRANLSHVEADHVHRALALERRRVIRDKGLRHDLDSLVLKMMRVYEVLGGNNAARRAVLQSASACKQETHSRVAHRSWTTHEFGELVAYFRRI